MTWALHVANLLILTSFLMRNILVLRFLSITGGIFFATYFLSQTPPMTAPVKWNILFACVNLIQIVRLIRANRKVPLCIEEVFLQDALFPSLRSLEIKSVFALSEVRTYSKNELIELSTDSFAIVFNGCLASTSLDSLFEQGDMLGIHAYFGCGEECVSLQVQSNTTLLQWSIDSLKEWCEETNERKTMLLSALSQNLVSKNV